MEKIIKKGMILFIVLQFLDVLSTYLVDTFREGEEMNPLAAIIMSYGYIWLIIYKLIAIIIIYLGINKICKLKQKDFAIAIIYWSVGVYSFVVLSNFIIFFFY